MGRKLLKGLVTSRCPLWPSWLVPWSGPRSGRRALVGLGAEQRGAELRYPGQPCMWRARLR